MCADTLCGHAQQRTLWQGHLDRRVHRKISLSGCTVRALHISCFSHLSSPLRSKLERGHTHCVPQLNSLCIDAGQHGRSRQHTLNKGRGVHNLHPRVSGAVLLELLYPACQFKQRVGNHHDEGAASANAGVAVTLITNFVEQRIKLSQVL